MIDIPRCSGVLLHVSSLPGFGTGDLGPAVFHWIDWLADAGQTLWQILPLVPVDRGGSPYNGLSALAGNPLLISPERLMEDGLVTDVPSGNSPVGPVDYPATLEWKDELLRAAFAAYRAGRAPHLREGFDSFRASHAEWLEDYALFMAIRETTGGAPWTEWDRPIRLRDPAATAAARARLADRIEDHAFRQFLFERQWASVRSHAAARGIRIVGDIPIFVAHDSADVWANRDLFLLDEEGVPTLVAGVPPDYFSETGQRWGNPLYRWGEMARRGYPWWTLRFRRAIAQLDVARVDHFRGFESYWEIPAEEETAIRGRWVTGPGAEFFHVIEQKLGPLPLIAEDLGLITPEVDALRVHLGLPGMRVLQFAFDGDPENPHLPENHPALSVSYTGTHDNDTVVGWWERADPELRGRVRARIPAGSDGIHWDLIRAAFSSPAVWAIVPLQDVLGLGNEGRMNTPGVPVGNWSWRFREESLSGSAMSRLRTAAADAGRVRSRF
jgi:4-alpha-glucanotransferase